MSKYENEQIGKIVIIKNIIFKNSLTNKNEVDHAWNRGRPCIIIYSDNEYDYFLPLKTEIKREKFEYHYFILDETKFLNKEITRIGKNNHKKNNKRVTEGVINLQTVYKIPISFHIETAKITFEAYKELMEKLKNYHKTENLETMLETAQSVRGR